MKKPKKQACDTLRGCLEYLESHWLTRHDYALGVAKAIGGGLHRVFVLDRHQQEALEVTFRHAGPGDWDIAEAVWDIQTFINKNTTEVAKKPELVK